MRSVHGVARYVGRARGWCGRPDQCVGAGTEGCGLHARSSAARISVQSVRMTSETSASCKSWPHPFHSFGHATAQGGMNGGSTVHSRHGDDPGRTRTCQMAENAGSSSAHVVSPQACQSAHGIIRLASPCAVGLLIAHFKPFANSARRGGGTVP